MKLSLLTGISLLPILTLIFGCSKNYQRIAVVPQAGTETVIQGQTNMIDPSHLASGRAALQKREYEKAIRTLKKAVSENPSGWEAYFYLGEAYLGAEEHDLARKMFDGALAGAGKNNRVRSDIYCGIARAWELQGELGKAELNFRTAINLNPESPTASSALLRLNRTSSR